MGASFLWQSMSLTDLGTLNGRPGRACVFAAGAVSTLWLKIAVSMQIERIGRWMATQYTGG
jgi:hypothetical protein